MTQKEDIVNTDRRRAAGGQVPDEDLEAVTGGLMRPLEPNGFADHGSSGRSDAGHDDTADA